MKCQSIQRLPPPPPAFYQASQTICQCYTPGKREALWKLSVLPKNTTHWPAQYLNLELSTRGLVIRGHCLSQCGLLHHHLPLTNTDRPSLYIHLSNKLWLLRIFLLICSILSFYINLYGKDFQVVVFSINILSFEIFSSQARKGRCLYLLQRLVSSVQQNDRFWLYAGSALNLQLLNVSCLSIMFINFILSQNLRARNNCKLSNDGEKKLVVAVSCILFYA